MNSNGQMVEFFFRVMIVLSIGITTIIFMNILMNDIQEYSQYKSFCEERPSFCYCDWAECTFKTSTSISTQYINGKLIKNQSQMSEDTIALCELAKELNDKKLIFETGCEE